MNYVKKIARIFAITVLLGAFQASLRAQESNLPLTITIAGVGFASAATGLYHAFNSPKKYLCLSVPAIVGGVFCIANCEGFADQINRQYEKLKS